MKSKWLLVLLSLLIANFASAQQLLNGGFEELYIDSPSISINGVDTFPTNWWFGWNTMDCGEYLGSITTESNNGDWAIKLETTNCQFGLNVGATGTRGIDPESQTVPGVSAHEINARPDQIGFHYKFQPVQGDSAGLRALLFNYPDTIPDMDPNPFSYIDTVAFVEVIISNTTDSYLQEIGSFDYSSLEVASYIMIGIRSNNNSWTYPEIYDNGHEGTTLWVDDIELIYLPTSMKEDKMEVGIQVFPNPTQDKFQIHYTDTLGIESIQMFDYQGRLVKNLDPQNHFHSMNGLMPGVYLVQLETDAGIFWKKVIKE